MMTTTRTRLLHRSHLINIITIAAGYSPRISLATRIALATDDYIDDPDCTRRDALAIAAAALDLFDSI